MDQNLVNALATALAQALRNTPAPTVVVNNNDSAKPDKYKGEKGRDLDRFISQLEAYWVTANVTADRAKVVTVLGRLTDKAAQWAIPITDHMAANGGALPANVSTWALLKEELQKYFGDATPEDTAVMELERLCNLEA